MIEDAQIQQNFVSRQKKDEESRKWCNKYFCQKGQKIMLYFL